jgi:flagellar biogenesis protein FliO
MSGMIRYLVETVALLGAFALAAVLVVLASRRWGPAPLPRSLSLVERLPLGGRRTVYLVRVGDRVYVIGASDSGLHKLGELPSGEALPATPPEAP